MTREILFLVHESPEGGYEAEAMGHSLYTEADTLDELRVQIRDTVKCHFEPAEHPDLVRLHFVHDEVMALA